jgi:hypothetical protein
MITTMTNNSKWKLNQNNYVIEIGSQSDGYNILKNNYGRSRWPNNFHLSESELDLEVKKM